MVAIFQAEELEHPASRERRRQQRRDQLCDTLCEAFATLEPELLDRVQHSDNWRRADWCEMARRRDLIEEAWRTRDPVILERLVRDIGGRRSATLAVGRHLAACATLSRASGAAG